MPAASSMRAALVLAEAISFIVGRGSSPAGPGREPEGRKTIAHGAQPWVAGGPRLPAPERGVRRAAARVLPSRPGLRRDRRSPSAGALGYSLAPFGLGRS